MSARAVVYCVALLMAPCFGGTCPEVNALDDLKHQIAYERTEEHNAPWYRSRIHANVWTRRPLTGFYIRERLRDSLPTIRKIYIFGPAGFQGWDTCPVEKNWQGCISDFAGPEGSNQVARTCAVVVDLHAIPPWRASPNDEKKRRVAAELRREIEAKWPGVRKIVIRDFNLKDPQITMYLRMPDGDYYQGCGFYSARTPHCEGWHLFGQAPLSEIRAWIFERPYRLK